MQKGKNFFLLCREVRNCNRVMEEAQRADTCATADYFVQRTLYVDGDEIIGGNVAAKLNGLDASVHTADKDFAE